MRLKVCGLKDKENVLEIGRDVLPDYMGFIFYDKSPRRVDESQLADIIETVPVSVAKVGVFVDETVEVMADKAKKYKLDYLQLHGNESAEMCRELSEKGYRVIKAFNIAPQFDFDLLLDYTAYVKFFLFDTKGENQGGNGYTFDWEILKDYDQQIPFFLSGGISLENVEEVKQFSALNIHALDVNSKFEISPGLKEVSKLKRLRLLMEGFENSRGEIQKDNF